jgi:MFS family permease
VVTAVLLVTCGRLSDVFGRVRLYNLGFLIFTVGSVLLYFIQGSGNTAALQLIGFRIVQGIGAAFLGYNPLRTLIPPSVLNAVSEATRSTVLGTGFFPSLLSFPFKDGVTVAFLISAALAVVAAIASLAGGRRYVHEVRSAPAPIRIAEKEAATN